MKSSGHGIGVGDLAQGTGGARPQARLSPDLEQMRVVGDQLGRHPLVAQRNRERLFGSGCFLL